MGAARRLSRILALTAPPASASTALTREARQELADRVLASVARYPEQAAALRAMASGRQSVLQANRRAGKTQGIMRWVLAQMLCRDSWLCVVITYHLAGPTDNFLDNGQDDCLLAVLRQLGLVRGRDYVVRRHGEYVKRIRFTWGSELRVVDAGSIRALDKSRGSAAHLYWADEAQSQPYLALMLAQIVGPARADHSARVVLSGTPSADVDSFFGRVCLGIEPGWERCELWSWNNPRFGSTVAERWQHLLSETILTQRGNYGITPANENTLRALTADELRAIARGRDHGLRPEVREMLSQVTADLLREHFGRWMYRVSEHVFAWRHPDLYFGRLAGVDGAEPIADTMRQRFALLPHRPGRQWRAAIGMDIGTTAPAAWLVMAFADDHPTAYELWSEKQEGLDDGQMFDRLVAIMDEVEGLGVQIAGIIADNKGMRLGTGKYWDRQLRHRLPDGVRIPKAVAIDGRIIAANLDLGAGRIRIVRGSPLDVEGANLRWKVRELGSLAPPVPDVERFITLPDGRMYQPGDHVLDCLCYTMQDLRHLWAFEPTNENEPRTAAELRAASDRAQADRRAEVRRRELARSTR
jgi:hypothetical protein